MCVIIGVILIALIIGSIWVIGIDDMAKNHPDYKGEDFLGSEDAEKNKGYN